jgi:hypothetical protein
MPARYKRVTPLHDELWIDTETGASFGNSETKEYLAYQEWLAQGGVTDDADPLPVNYSDNERHTAQVLTTNSTSTELWRYTTTNKTGYDIVIRIIAVDKGNGAIKKQSVDATVSRIGATPNLVGRTDQVSHTTGGTRGNDAHVAEWQLNPSFDGYDLVLSVVGADQRNIDWHATISMVKFAPDGIVTAPVQVAL